MSSATLDQLEHVPTEWLLEAHRVGARVASVCSGAFALAQAGLLDGRQCTTHWKLVERLRREAPRAQVLENRLFVEDGGVVSSAGAAAGIDMALALVEWDHGPLVASRVAREMVVYLRRSGDQAQLSVQPRPIARTCTQAFIRSRTSSSNIPRRSQGSTSWREWPR